MADNPKNVQFINAAENREPSGVADINERSSGLESKKTSEEISLEEMADRFIQVANDLVQTQKIGQVSRAMRLATSMFNSHEYALKSPDMEVDRFDTTEWFVKEFRSMLDYHMDMLKAEKDSKGSDC